MERVALRVLVALLTVSTLLGGCSSGLLGSATRTVTPERQVAVNNQLALPPDLQLRAPTTNAQAYQPGAAPMAPAPQPLSPVSTTGSDALYGDGGGANGGGVTQAPAGDVYTKYGISRTKPDGTAKSDAELKAELKKAVLAKKREANPNYGTIFNIGNIFSDN